MRVISGEQVCKKAKYLCYVVSRNKDWSKFAESRPDVLRHLESLEQYLDLLLRDRKEAEVAIAIFRLYPELFDAALRETFELSGFYLTDRDGEGLGRLCGVVHAPIVLLERCH